jgi:hypothetical protein
MNTIKAIFSVATLVVSVSVVAVEITVDKVTQRYPWNGIVDIEYTIDDGGVQLGSNYCVQVLAIDHSQTPAVTNSLSLAMHTSSTLACSNPTYTYSYREPSSNTVAIKNGSNPSHTLRRNTKWQYSKSIS